MWVDRGNHITINPLSKRDAASRSAPLQAHPDGFPEQASQHPIDGTTRMGKQSRNSHQKHRSELRASGMKDPVRQHNRGRQIRLFDGGVRLPYLAPRSRMFCWVQTGVRCAVDDLSGWQRLSILSPSLRRRGIQDVVSLLLVSTERRPHVFLTAQQSTCKCFRRPIAGVDSGDQTP